MRYLTTLPHLFYSLWILATDQVSSSGSNAFLTTVVPSSLVCETLCKYTTKCVSYTWGVQPRRCHLHSQQPSIRSVLPQIKVVYTGMCANSPCGGEEICFPVEGGTTYICAPSPTSTDTSAPQASTATSVNTASTLAPTVTTASTSTAPTSTATTTTTIADVATTTTAATTTAASTNVNTTAGPTTATANTMSATATTTIASTASTATDPYTYRGCFIDDLDRALSAISVISSEMKPELCWMFCLNHNMTFFGLEVGEECFCDAVIQPGHAKVADSQCSRPCSGDNGAMCGDNWRIAIYQIFT
ncbi:uncharacterized protein [Haliotis cracherodii]|uniref:uncharacterized protein n=1 Tax=Haliotis cracherodii TaxID=6455 RepID=UPI0039EAD051